MTQPHLKRIASVAMLLAATACGGSGASEMDEAMRRDLESVQAGTIELAPAAPGQQVVSPLEQGRAAPPRPQAPQQTTTPTREVVEATPTPEPEPVDAEPAASRPTTTPRVSPPPPGGYKTINEVIRNAPFPIKPATDTNRPPRPGPAR